MKATRPRGPFFVTWRGALLVLSLALLLTGWSAPAAQAESVRVPVSLDYPLVRSLMVQRAFEGPGESAVVVDELDGCTRIVLSQPQVTPVMDRLSVACRIKVRAGAPVMGKCVKPVEWEGYIQLFERPYLEQGTWLLRLNTEDSKLYDREQGPPAKVAQIIWDVIKTHVHAYLDNKVGVNLAPPVKDLKEFVPLIFPAQDQPRVAAWLGSLRPGQTRVTPAGLQAELIMQVEPGPPAGPEAPLHISQADLERFISAWQQWDAFLVLQINSMARFSLTAGERRVLLETLLDTRYRFVRELNDPETLGRKDVVREQFVAAWNRLAPVMRRHLEKETEGARLSYLAFFTASDALAALDKLGPTLGLDISRNGLIRLARLLTAKDKPDLGYSYAVDSSLRRTLGLGPALDESGPALNAEELDAPPGDIEPEPAAPSGAEAPPAATSPAKPSGPYPWSSRLSQAPGQWLAVLANWLVVPAWASVEPRPEDWAQIKPWLLSGNNRDVYLERIKEALRLAAHKLAGNGQLDAAQRQAFENLVKASAWQESCFRQFISPGGKITFIRSSNNTSVGMMQVNERVWRGLYNTSSLRWNALYNIKAGTDILHLYLTRYGLDRQVAGRPMAPDLLAQAVYAMYNGGPGQLDNFLKRQARKSPSLHDRLFYDKYEWVRTEQWDKLQRCLGD